MTKNAAARAALAARRRALLLARLRVTEAARSRGLHGSTRVEDVRGAAGHSGLFTEPTVVKRTGAPQRPKGSP